MCRKYKFRVKNWCFIDNSCNVCCCSGDDFWPWTLTLTTLNVKISIWNHARSILCSKILGYPENYEFSVKTVCFIDHPCNVCCCFGAFWPWTLTLTTLNVKISIWNHARSILRSKIHIYAENFDFTMKNVGFINHFLNLLCSKFNL